MSDLAHARVNLFPNSRTSTPTDAIPLEQALEAIRTGRYQSRVLAIRKTLDHQGKSAYDREKTHLPALTFAGTFAPSRGNAHLKQHTGIVHGDLDDVSDVDAVKDVLCQDPCTAYCFVSPSGNGLKLGVHVPLVTSDAGYKHAWQAVSDVYRQQYGVAWDVSGKDIARLCFVSYDPALYWNPDAEIFEVPPPPAMNPPPPPSTRRSGRVARGSYQGAAERAVKTAVEMIEAAPLGTRHHTRVKAARLLGGYVAGGLLREDEVYGVLARALKGHTENLERALKDVEAGLRYGKDNPITPEDLEAERQAWLDTRRSPSHNIQSRESRRPAGDEDSPPLGGSMGDKPCIRITTDMTGMVDDLQRAILALPGPRLFQRARQLCILGHGIKPPK
jgi:VirE N-terminal domain